MYKRVGPKMIAAASYVRRNPGCCKLDVARAIGPSTRYGYNAVNRAIKARLITAELTTGGRYYLHPAMLYAGQRVLSSRTGATGTVVDTSGWDHGDVIVQWDDQKRSRVLSYYVIPVD